MRRSPAFAAAGLLCAVFAAGCSDHSLPRASASATHDDPPRLTGGPPVESPREDAAVARVNGKPITREQLVKPLIDTYGLNLLLNMIQLELARQNAAKAGLKVTPEDVAREKQFMLKGFFPDAKEEDYQQLLVQLLKQQNITQAQWEILLQTNACLRKMAEPLCAGKITEENIQQAFDLRYGAQVKIRDIQVSNIKEAQEVKKRLAEGQKFEEVAKALSQDTHTASQGGEWPAFAANSTTVSDLIKEQAFGLKPGEVSDPLNTGNAIHVITVEKRIAPVVAKLDAPTHEYLRSALMDKIVQEYVKALRNQLAQQALKPDIMQITDPELKKQFDQKVAEHEAAVKEEENARRMTLLRPRPGLPATLPTPVPAPVPATNPGTTPAKNEATERPPATRSGPATLPAAPDAQK